MQGKKMVGQTAVIISINQIVPSVGHSSVVTLKGIKSHIKWLLKCYTVHELGHKLIGHLIKVNNHYNHGQCRKLERAMYKGDDSFFCEPWVYQLIIDADA